MNSPIVTLLKKEPLTPLQSAMVEKAIEMYGNEIYPIGQKQCLSQCFTEYKRKKLFWFDTKDRSTHIIHEKNVTEAL